MRGRSRVTGRSWGGNGFQPAMLRAHARASVLSVIPGNRRRNSIAADSSPSLSQVARIAAASASVMTNIPKALSVHMTAGKRRGGAAGLLFITPSELALSRKCS